MNETESGVVAVVVERVAWNDVLMLRTLFDKKKRQFDWFEIPAELLSRWSICCDDYATIQHEIKQFAEGARVVLPRRRRAK